MRTLLIGVLVVAVFISGVLWLQWRSRWSGVPAELRSWASKVDRTDGKIEQYSRLTSDFDPEQGFSGSHNFAVLTGEAQKVVHTDGSTGWIAKADRTEDPSRFFVIPPGIWVDDIEGVIRVWDRHYNEGRQDH